MMRFHARFSDGPAGIALLLMRIAQAMTGLAIASRMPAWVERIVHPKLLVIVAGLLLVAGLYVRPTAAVLVLLCLLAAVSWRGPAQYVLLGQAGSGLALALLGAGAYSLDARLFGRRVIDLTERRPRGREKGPPKS
jgi:uncharacterized membrane protein YphA (DoxX/SURF4 family)